MTPFLITVTILNMLSKIETAVLTVSILLFVAIKSIVFVFEYV